MSKHPPSRACTLLTCLLLLCGDIESNPGPANTPVYPCGLCEMPVTWEHHDGLCCDGCDIWHHRSCIELCSADYDLLAKHKSVQWLCCKCDSVNMTSFTFRSFELSTTNSFHCLAAHDLNSTVDSLASNPVFDPSHVSSPTDRLSTSRRRQPSSHSQSSTNTSSLFCVSEKRNLRIMNVNCRSLGGGRHAHLEAALNYIKPDIVCGTESWLKGVKPGKPPSPDATKSSEVFPTHYRAYRNDRGSLGGGVFVLIHEDLVAEEKPELVTECELEWVKVKLKGRKDLLVASFYMPHRRMEDVNELRKSLELLDKQKDKVTFLAGDFNCPDINWQNLTVEDGASDKAVQQAVLDLSVDFNLTQTHDEPTRENRMLDLTFTNNPSLIKSSTTAPGISDHDIVVVDSNTRPYYSKQKPRRCFIFSKANWDDLKTNVAAISSKVVQLYKDETSVHQLWNTFKEDLQSAISKHIPSKMKTRKNSTPWITRSVKRHLRRKAKLYKKAKKTNNWTKYRQCQKDCKRHLRQAEWTHINKVIDEGLKENNTKPFWQYVKSKNEDNIGIAPLRSQGHLVTDPKGRAEILVEQFQSVFTKDDANQKTPPLPKRVDSETPPLTIGAEGVLKLLRNIKVNKAAGPDELPNRVLQSCAAEATPAITAIFQRSVDTGELPYDWRNANVAPVYKKGDRHTAENYRPVSLTCVVSKLLEHIICHHILNHLDNNNKNVNKDGLVYADLDFPKPRKGQNPYINGHDDKTVYEEVDLSRKADPLPDSDDDASGENKK
ncbi:LORF2-like protein [Mya arenaria]|uniref:LORF2-like protein n=1 Tax=Mya arenaria TaxID=6604 RepID=A0ABY7E7M6_MYAAR|nr:LORF2-like protein [Mya arenaria]